jgi:hypothetical protein
MIDNWSMKSVMLACSRFRGSHTAENIAEEFQNTMDSFDISSKVSFIITDSAANMMKAFSLPGFEKFRNEHSEGDEHSEDENDNLQPVEDEDIYDELIATTTHVIVCSRSPRPPEVD